MAGQQFHARRMAEMMCFPARGLSQSGSTGISHPRRYAQDPERIRQGATLLENASGGKCRNADRTEAKGEERSSRNENCEESGPTESNSAV